jgi:crotonobetainyl-CoA:carnitine CoA-transferase CaiB-like acyl-CoA transferase
MREDYCRIMTTATDPTPSLSGPLAGLVIIDLTAVVLGAYAAQMLGDLGADVIKVEAPGGTGVGGDVMRWAGASPRGTESGMGAMFMQYNRNKRSVVLDLKTASGRTALSHLIRRADAFIANRPASALAKLGLSYQDVSAIKPDIVYANAPGYGSQGPYADFPAYDELIQAGSGAAQFLPRTYEDGKPRYLPTLMSDKVGGLFLVQGVLAALVERQRTGRGQAVEAPMLECVTHFNLSENLFGAVYEPPVGPYGYQRILNPERRPYRSRDGWIAVSPYSDRNWRDFFAIVGEEETFLADARFNTYPERIKNIRALYAMVEGYTIKRTSEEWFEACAARNIPCMRVNALEDLVHDPHLSAVGFFEERQHPTEGGTRALRHPVSYSGKPSDAPNTFRDQPTMGQHTRDCLMEAGLSPEDIDRLAAEGAFG